MKNEILNIRNIIIVLLVFILIGVTRCSHSKQLEVEKDKNVQVNIVKALTDSMTTFKNERDEIVQEKLSLQAEMEWWNDENIKLTKNQANLIKRNSELSKENTLIASALIEAEMEIKNLKGDGLVKIDTTKAIINFSDSIANISYDVSILNVRPYKLMLDSKPQIIFNTIKIPNEMFVEFHWKDDKKTGYPVSFSVTNSNVYMKTKNMDSFIIPEIYKPKVKPTGWQKVEAFFNENSKTIGKISIGVGIGAVGALLLTR